MKILWCVNILLPDAAKAIGAPQTPFGGWMVSLSADLAKTDGIKLAVATLYAGNALKKLEIDNITYYLIPGGPKAMLQRGTERLRGFWREVVKNFNPDVLHLHGTEYAHGLALLDACPDIPSVVSIQGLLGVIQKHFYAGMEFPDVYLRPSFRDIIRLDPLWNWRKSFKERAVYEREILNKVIHVTGRTTWDFANAKAINPKLTYHHCNDGLRDPFYQYQWAISKVKRHSIFTTQAGYPIKGLHILLKALSILKSYYPDVKLYVAGAGHLSRSFSERIRITGYTLYINKMIKKLDLHDNVVFTGLLDAEGIANMLLKSHLFVVPSAVENGCNALHEAMILGVPSIAAFSGGMTDMMVHKENGFMYPFMEDAMLAEYIRRIFMSDELAGRFSAAGRASTSKRHDRKKITDTMIGIYRNITSQPR